MGARCECGAVCVLDETGKSGGQALLDALAMLCDDDLDRALALSSDDYETKRRLYDRSRHTFLKARGARMAAQPHVWIVRLKESDEEE